MASSPRNRKPAELSRGQKVCAFIERYCLAPEGDHIGKPIKLEAFQRKFILDIYDNPVGTHSAYLSIARKNGKTALIASILLAHLCGPEAVQNSQIVSGAQSKEQAAVETGTDPAKWQAPDRHRA
jgi:phage terminase large subunit-like protein